MAQVLVTGAGVGGLSAAMVLARDGHEVTVVERDPAPPPGDPDAASAASAWDSWERRGVNQFRLPHFLQARWRQEAERDMPDAVVALERWGALRINLVEALPADRTGGFRAGDEVFTAVTARRPVIEAALAAAAEATPGVTVRRGVAVAGLLAGEPRTPGVPHVVGLRTEAGDELRADLVVDMTGRRSPLPGWLSALGAAPPVEEREDSGFVYYGRHYQGDRPDLLTGLLQHHPSVSLLTLPADDGTWSVAFICSARDAALRGLRDPARFEAALDHYPTAARWKEGRPLGGVDVMAKIEDRHRRLVVDGDPVVTGVVAAGDSWACTNPSLGRGISIGLLHVGALRDVLREVAPGNGEAVAFARRWDEVTEATVAPLYRATVAFDRHRLAEIDADIAGRAYEPEDPGWAVATALSAGAGRDPEVLRAQLRIAGVLATPPEVAADPDLRARILAAGEGQPRYGLPGADRATLVATVSTVSTVAA
jgi:2-polyprenyl-6-methoxyphenol hydroxylase-like FAD-dependent oxidoreductase